MCVGGGGDRHLLIKIQLFVFLIYVLRPEEFRRRADSMKIKNDLKSIKTWHW